jgi:hypothetical protein
MRTRHLLCAVVAIGSIFAVPVGASAGEWGCGRCQPAYYEPPSVSYAPPTYIYAQPTVTVVPRVIVQPNYVVERTFVTHPTEYVRETSPCWFGCDGGFRVVNQGQYPTFQTYAPDHDLYWTNRNPGPYVALYPAMRHSNFEMPRRNGYEYRRARHVVDWSHHHKRKTPRWSNRYRGP